MTSPTNPAQPPLDQPESDPTVNPGPDTPGPEQPVADPPQEPGPEDPEVLGSATPQGGPEQLQRDPQEWVTGEDPATEAQKSYLDRLASTAGEQISADGLTKAQASEHIDRLQARTGMEPRQS